MPSLSSYDKGTKGFEGRRFSRDVDATIDALKRINAPIHRINKKRSRHKQYRPRKIMCGGNHEHRIPRAANFQPELDGTLSIETLQYRIHGWEFYPFRDVVKVDGIAYSHYFPSGLTGAAISGENIGASLVKKLHMSCVQGHSHLFNHYEHTRPDGSKIFGLSAGCFVHKNYREDWCRNTVHMWWRGVVILDGCGHWDGYYEEINAICQRRILDKFL